MHITICGALYINHLYIGLFLAVTKLDSLGVNILAWTLVIGRAFFNPSKNNL